MPDAPPPRRTAKDRLAAIPAATARGDDFRRRVDEAAGDAIRLADLMAEAIGMDRAARGLDVVGRDGRVVFSIESLVAAHCLDAARDAYLRARGANHE